MDEKKYRNFVSKEIVGLDENLITLLDDARDIAGIDFIITSGKRTIEEEKALNGVLDSAHLTGMAADLRCKSSWERMRIVKALIQAGIPRIGISKTHIHADIDKTKPYPIIFLEY